MECAHLRAIDLPEGLLSIGEGAFASCTALTAVTLPESLRQIGQMAFFETGLPSIRIPAGVEVIGEMAFWSCPSLVRAEVFGPHTKIMKSAFGSCPRLTEGYLAPGFPDETGPGDELLSVLLWCADPSRHTPETSARAAAFLMENENLVLTSIFKTDNTRALRGLLSSGPPEVLQSIAAHTDHFLMQLKELGRGQEMQAALLHNAMRHRTPASENDAKGSSDDDFDEFSL